MVSREQGSEADTQLWSWYPANCPLPCRNMLSIHTRGDSAGHLFLLGTAQRLGDRFLVPGFGMACCALSSPWLKISLKY